MYGCGVSLVGPALASLNHWFPLHYWDKETGFVPSFVEARRLLASMQCVPPFEIVKLLVKLVPTSN